MRIPRTLAAATLLWAAALAAHAQPVAQATQREALRAGIHLYMATKADPALAGEFARLTEPLVKHAPWISAYGTTSPSAIEQIDGRAYHVFHGCKPHDCITESYTVLYDAAARRIVAGAFVRNTFDGARITESRISWLGKPAFDTAGALAKYLY